jgi:integrase
MPVVGAWKKEIATARNEPVDDDAAYWRRALRNAKTDERRQAILEQIDMAAWDIGATNVENIGEAPSSDPEARWFYKSATGQLVSFTEHLDEWLSTSRATAKTQDMQRSDVMRFAAKFAIVQDVTRPEVRRWITGLMNDDGLAPKTVQRILSALRGYWRYLQSIEVAGEDHEPFSKLDVARQNKRTEPRSKRQPFEPADVLKLLDAAGDQNLADLIRLGMWTGCRIEELCALKVEQVKGDHFSVGDAKTKAGWRDLPIHRELAQTMARLIAGSKDGYVLSGLTVNKYGNRSNGIGKRFGKLKSAMGFGAQHVFHSIRKTVVTILENAGVPENVVADIVGHEKTTMTFGLYSGGLSLAVKRDALGRLAY